MNFRKPLAIVLALVLFGMIAPVMIVPVHAAGLYTPGIGDPNYSVSFSLVDPTMTTLTLPSNPINTQFWAYVWLNNATMMTIDGPQFPAAGVGGIEVHINLTKILNGFGGFCDVLGFLNFVTGNPGIGAINGVFGTSAPGELIPGILPGLYVGGTQFQEAFSTTHVGNYYTTYVPPMEPWGTAGLVAAIQFNCTGQPTLLQPDFTGKIDFTTDLLTNLVDAAGPGAKIMFDEFPALLTIPHALPPAFPYPTTEPMIYLTDNTLAQGVGSIYDMSGSSNNTHFNVTVAIGNNKNTFSGVDPAWDVAGFDVGIMWNNTLINYVAGYLGQFLKSGLPPDYNTQGLQGNGFTNGFNDTVVGDQGRAEAVFTRTADPAPLTGIDSLAIFEFKIVYAPPAGELVTSGPAPNPNSPGIALVRNNTAGFYMPDLATWSHPEILSPPWNASITAMDMGPPNSGPLTWIPNGGYPIPPGFFGVGLDATYTAPYTPPFHPFGYIDLMTTGPDASYYTDSLAWNNTFNGYGQDVHSDSFTMQQNMTLYTKVTFNGGLLVNKLVSFQVNDALGIKYTVGQNYTDHNGIATFKWRVPQQIDVNGTYASCGMDPQVFGWWNATATVEIDQIIVNDTMQFQVGWLIQVLRVDITSPTMVRSTALGQYVNFTSTLNTIINEQTMDFTVLVLTIHEQKLTATFSVDTYDVQGYPLTENLFTYTVNATRVPGVPGNTTGGVYEFGHVYYTTPLSLDILPEYFHEDPAGTTPTLGLPSGVGSIAALLPYWARLSPYSASDAFGHASVIGYAFTDLPAHNGVPYGPQSNANDDYLPSNPLVPIDEIGYGTGTPFYIG